MKLSSQENGLDDSSPKFRASKKWILVALVACLVAGYVWMNSASKQHSGSHLFVARTSNGVEKTDIPFDTAYDTAYDTTYDTADETAEEDDMSDVNVVEEDVVETEADRRKRRSGVWTRVFLRGRPRRKGVDLVPVVFRGNLCWKYRDLRKVVAAMRKNSKNRRRRCRIRMKYVRVKTNNGLLRFKTKVKLLVIRSPCRSRRRRAMYFVWQSGCRSKSPTKAPTKNPTTSSPTKAPTPSCTVPYGIVTNMQVSKLDASRFTRCYYQPYSAHTTVAALEAACPDAGPNTMWFVGAINSASPDVIVVGAQVPRSLAITRQSSSTVAQNAFTKDGKTVYFYYYYISASASTFGFAPSSSVSLRSCDVLDRSSPERLCWHMHGHVGGYRAGSNVGLNSNNQFYKVVYTRSTPC